MSHLDPDHPGTMRMEREALAGLREEDRAQADLESIGMSAASAEVVTLRRDRADRDIELMARAERRADYDNWGRC